MKKGITFCLLFLMLSSFVLISEDNFPFLVKTKLENYNKVKWPEKIYVHTDKPYYTINDSLWFTVYLVNGITHIKSTKSKVLYVELINTNDSIIEKRKLFIDDVSVQGDFKINKNWAEGKYTLRAYTNYMRNASPSYFFQKKINIWTATTTDSTNGSESSKPIKTNENSNKPEIYLYPEGGHLVENLSSKVAVKIKNNMSNDLKLSGYITDNEDTYITSCEIYDFGLGLFYLTPTKNNTYYFNIEINDSKYRYQLPKALPLGYNLTTTYKGNYLFVGLNSSIEKGLKGSFLVLHQRGKILYNKVLTEKSNNYSIGLSTDDISEGVAHLTLFNPDGNPVCERLVFIENEKSQASIQIKNDKTVAGVKEKISLTLSTEDFNKSNLSSSLSLSVRYSNTTTQNENSENIKSWLLLNSDLRGEIKNPGYFFSKPKNQKKQFLLDLVMMTNGWRRFTWQNLLYEKYKTDEFVPEKGIIISGNTKLLEKPYSLTPSYTSLTFIGDEINVQPVQKSGADGKFSFGPFVFYDSIPIIIQSRLNDYESKKPKDRELRISRDSLFTSPKIPKNIDFKSLDNTANETANYLKMKDYIRDVNFKYYQNSQNLDEVVVIAKKRSIKTEREKQMDDRSMYNMPSYRLDLESDPSLSNQLVVNLIGQFPGLIFNGRAFTFRGSSDNPRFIIDDIEATFEDVVNLTVAQISFIDFYRDANASIFSNSNNGVITIYTRLGRSLYSSNTKRKPGIINFDAKGFYTAKEFYSPNYAKDTNNKDKADIRTTLYWNPKIRITERDSLKNISFFTGDVKGNYIIEIEGISDTGIPLYQTSSFYVE